MMRNRPIVLHVLALALAAVVPFWLLSAYNVYDRFRAENGDASATVLRLAESTAFDMERFLQRARSLLEQLSDRPLVRALDPAHCDPLLAEFARVLPQATALLTINTAGHPVCSVTVAPGEARALLEPDRTAAKGEGADGFMVGQAAQGSSPGQWVVTLELPLLEAGKRTGLIALAVDLHKLSRTRNEKGLPPSAVAGILDSKGRIITQSSDAERWIGRATVGVDIVQAALATPRGGERGTGWDGVERIYGFTGVRGTSWHAMAGVPVSVVHGPVMQEAMVSAALGLLIAAAAGALCYRIARHITEPITAIVEHSRQAGAGNLRIRVQPKGPAEVATMATQFNGILDALHAADERLRASERRLAGIIDSAMDAIITVDENHAIILMNPAAEKMFGYSGAQFLGKPVHALIPAWPPSDSDQDLDRFAKAVGPSADSRGKLRQIVGVRASGAEFPLEASISMLQESSGKLLTVILRDITYSKQDEVELRGRAARLQHLSRQLMSVEEQERRRLGMELHDRTGANLSALLLSMEVFRSQLPPTLALELEPRIIDAEALLRETIAHMRDVLSGLRPPALDELGLLAALTHYVHLVGKRTNLDVSIQGQEPFPRLPPGVEIFLFRIAQEALNNATQHAHALHIIVALHVEGDRVALVISDDGIGFDASSPRRSTSLGLVTMRERAESLGATFMIESSPGQGARVTVLVPHPPAAARPL